MGENDLTRPEREMGKLRRDGGGERRKFLKTEREGWQRWQTTWEDGGGREGICGVGMGGGIKEYK